MMIVNYNIGFRNTLIKSFDKSLLSGNDISETADKIMNFMYSIEDTDKKHLQVFRYYMIGLMFTDAYKVYNYKIGNNVATDEDIEFFSLLSSIENSDDLLSEISANIYFLKKIIIACYEFGTLDRLSQILYIGSLSEEQSKKVKSFSSVHQQDIDYYMNEISLNDLVKEFDLKRNYQNNFLEIDFEDAIYFHLISFLRKYYFINKSNAIQLISEIGRIDCQFSEYLKEKGYDSQIYREHLDFYTQNDISDIISKLLLDTDFLKNALVALISVYVNKEYEGISIVQEEVDGKSELVKKFKRND